MKGITACRYIVMVIMIVLISGCGQNRDNREKVIIFHAGSLAMPMKEIAKGYMELHPEVTVELEAAGSVACARKITELKKPCDIMASADHEVIDQLLIPSYASWCLKFAANSMVIAYTPRSGRSDEISADNWIDILLDKDIFYGRSDPNSDPCGYRTIMVLELAEKYYGRSGIMEQFTGKDVNMVRPKEVDLLALLESNAIDYIFIYRSVAEQHGLEYLDLPAEINLSDQELNELYSQVSVEINGSGPGERITITGSNMIYGVTILDNAPNRDRAVEFMQYMLGEQGSKIIGEMGQEVISPALASSFDSLPGELKKFSVQDQSIK